MNHAEAIAAVDSQLESARLAFAVAAVDYVLIAETGSQAVVKDEPGAPTGYTLGPVLDAHGWNAPKVADNLAKLWNRDDANPPVRAVGRREAIREFIDTLKRLRDDLAADAGKAG